MVTAKAQVSVAPAASRGSSPSIEVDLHKPAPELFLNRELSWMTFNQRVLAEARDPTVPLLERLKFVAIASSNLDEFFMVRVAGLIGQQRDNVASNTSDGMSPAEQLAGIAKAVLKMRAEMSEAMTQEILPELAARGVRLLSASALKKEGKEQASRYFREQVLPVLTPLAIDPGHPFPHLRNKSLNLVAVLQGGGRKAGGPPAFAVIQVPSVLPRLVRLSAEEKGDVKAAYVLLDDLIANHVGTLFPGFHSGGAWAFRVIRNFDLSIDEEEAEDLLESMKQEVRRRDRGNAVSVLVDARASAPAIELLRESIMIDRQYVIPVDGPLALPDLSHLGESLEGDATLRDEPFVPAKLPPFRFEDDVFSVIAKEDVILHHPYESFDPVVHFVEQAASDPAVLAIKQTLYRTSGDSPIVKALMRAAENHKQVTALVEIKARFDEENNILWARRMEEAGVHVVYGLVGLKTHAKACLVVRRESGGLRRYVHLGTGNYNPSTARSYTDLSFFTANHDIGEDTASLFNLLTSCTAPSTWKKLVVAPLGLHERILGLIEREATNARAGKPARIIAKMNSLIDGDVIMALYRASAAGVEIDLIVRGICGLRPGIPGVSDRIRVRSIVDRFLEHARIFFFEAGGAHEVYCASADWMQRNFQRRIEVLFPIEDVRLRTRIVDEILAIEMKDDVKARFLQADGRIERAEKSTGTRAQSLFLQKVRDTATKADEKVQHERPFVVRPVRRAPTMVGEPAPSPTDPPIPTTTEGRISNVESFPAPRDPNAS